MTRALGKSLVLAMTIGLATGCVVHEESKVCNEVTDAMCMALRLTGDVGPIDELALFAMVSQKVDTTEWFTRRSA